VRPLVIALVVSFRNRRDGRVATFRPIPQSVSGVGVRFSIGYKIRNLGDKSFCLTRCQRKFFILLRCCNHYSFFILTELGVGRIVGNVVAFLWRGAWGGFGGTNVRPLIIALVVSVRNLRDGRVATFRPIPQSVSGVGVRFSIGYKIRNLGEKYFCLTRRQRKFFILPRCCNHFSFFILTELGVGRIIGNVVAFLS
jgi:hypothetical protein